MVADIWGPSGPSAGTVVVIHGGFWNVHIDRRHASHVAHALASDGWKAISVEYPRVPGQPDQTHQAVEHVLVELMAHHIPNAPALLVGHSVGGQLALCATSIHVFGFTSQVLLAPVTSLQQAEELYLGEGAVQSFLGGPATLRPDLDPRQLAPPTVPTIIVHGEADQRVPISMSEQYVQGRPGVTLVKIPRAGHLDLIDPRSPHWPIVHDAMRMTSSPSAAFSGGSP